MCGRPLRIVIPFRSIPFSFRLSVRVTGCCCFPLGGLRGLLGPNPVSHNGHRPGYTLDELPAHRRTLTDGICTSGATLGFSILLKDTSTCSSVPPRGAGIRTSDLLITSPPALPTESFLTVHNEFLKKTNSRFL